MPTAPSLIVLIVLIVDDGPVNCRHFEPRLVTAFADILPRILELKA